MMHCLGELYAISGLSQGESHVFDGAASPSVENDRAVRLCTESANQEIETICGVLIALKICTNQNLNLASDCKDRRDDIDGLPIADKNYTPVTLLGLCSNLCEQC